MTSDRRSVTGDAAPARGGSAGSDHRVTALALAVLLVVGGGMGLLNLALDGVVREGTVRWTYGLTMATLLLAALVLAVRRRVDRWSTFGLVLLGQVIYAVVALCVEDPVRHATPMMLLFVTLTAAWFLDGWMFAVSLAVTPVSVLVAMVGSYPDRVDLAVQVVVHAGMLDVVATGVFLLRRRVERLLVATEELSQRDPLTGLANRRHLVEQAPRLWRHARREGLRVAALVIDLDHFKQVNDVHGHAAGDAVLRAVAGALGDSVRPSDVLARLGGEEMVVLGLVGDPAEAGRLAERLRHAVSAARTGAGHAVTASIGVALTRPADGDDAAAELWWLVDRADAAMYAAKQGGRDRVAWPAPPRPRPAPPAERVDPPTVPGPALPSDAG
ncbi:diguanylate cyclase [Geodermatophilus sp. SYSU D01119]